MVVIVLGRSLEWRCRRGVEGWMGLSWLIYERGVGIWVLAVGCESESAIGGKSCVGIGFNGIAVRPATMVFFPKWCVDLDGASDGRW